MPLITYIDDFALGVGYYLASSGTQVNASKNIIYSNIRSIFINRKYYIIPQSDWIV